MKNADNRKYILLFFLIFLLAIAVDITDGIIKNGTIQRNDSMDGEKEVELIFNIAAAELGYSPVETAQIFSQMIQIDFTPSMSALC